ncbi:AraC family transcriptional regulator [Neorhodopirellula pilleata]|uniref:Xylose operon regulatory protein n=1 Tax=Neorhodopirellula pilleata TaxID=2714738 RepID=A0A5C6A2V3_9BACT|nr:DNA-binding transcriptional regulator [Neorhodopirellula pilleata]TWT93726.1 Xylose operon regulatory protein [Neorhodopirellula pilleata]
MKKLHHVALLIETSNAYARGVLEGIVSYIHEHDPWSIYLPEQERGAKPPSWIKDWRGDGLIVRIETEEIAKTIKRLNKPVVDVSAARRVEGIPWVETNDHAIAQLAVEHFTSRGFKNLAFCGDPDFNWSRWREEGFIEETQTRPDLHCNYFTATSRTLPHYSWNREKNRLAKWIESLPKPVGIFACYDIRAQQVLDICREQAIDVPDEVAVLGVDNDELLCNLCYPPLSSVIPDAYRTGREAAKLLDRMMNGGEMREERHLIEPLGVATRQSSDVLAIEDPDIATAIRFIRENACEGINVKDILKQVPMTRRAFELRFHALLGRTPHQEIIRQRVERVKRLLIETDLPLKTIARNTRFEHEEYMSVVFRRATGMPPGQYRQSRNQ